ncbi:MAG: helix-turn-helix domain-containing protein [Candidatus Anammoxibacter sp.]
MRQSIHVIDIMIGKNLRKFRIEKGCSQSDLTNSLKEKITYQMLQKYETAKSKISASLLLEFAQILKVPLSDFYKSGSRNKVNNPSLEEIRLIKSLRLMPNYKSKLIKSLIKIFK